MSNEQIVAITKFMNDNNGRVTMEEDNEWAAVNVYTLMYISTDHPLKQLHICIGGRFPIIYL